MQSKNDRPRWQTGAIITAFVIVATAALLHVWQSGQPVDLPDSAHAALECASYTPSHDGHMLSVPEKRALVAADLKILAQRFRCVRTYSVSEGLDDVPRVARDLGLKVMLGLWISSHAPSNDREIARGIELANQNSDVVEAIIVGNEVLLRREQTAAQLRSLIERVRSATKIPVTYADVWEFWLRNANLAQSTDFVTIHILPYWEDHPIGIEHALDHVRSIYAKVQLAFPGRKVVIGETGWPSVGRPRLDAVPSPVNQARFIREFVAYAERERIPYNLIEAFDQPWKRIQEGTVGGSWGLYDADGNSKFAFTGPVVAFQSAHAVTFGVLGLGVLLAIASFALTRDWIVGLLVACAANAGGVALLEQWRYMQAANRTTLEWAATSSWSAIGWLAYCGLCLSLIQWTRNVPISRLVGIGNVVRSWGLSSSHSAGNKWLGVLRFGFLLCAAYVAIAQAYEGRGRDFPIALLALPTFALALIELATSRNSESAATESTWDHEEWLLALVLVISSAYVGWRETLLNSRAVLWCALNLLLAGSVFASHWRARSAHPRKRTEQQPHPA